MVIEPLEEDFTLELFLLPVRSHTLLRSIQTGCVDWVLPLDKISRAITSLVRLGERLGEYCE